MRRTILPYGFILAAMLMGCGNPADHYVVEADPITVEGVDAGVTRVTFDVTCKEYADRNEADVCAGEELCVTVHWVNEAYELSQILQGDEETTLSSRTIAQGTACRTYTATPQRQTFTITPKTRPPAGAVRQLVVRGVSSTGDTFATPMTLEGKIYEWSQAPGTDATDATDATDSPAAE